MILNIILEVGKISFFNLLKVVPIPTILMGPKKVPGPSSSKRGFRCLCNCRKNYGYACAGCWLPSAGCCHCKAVYLEVGAAPASPRGRISGYHYNDSLRLPFAMQSLARHQRNANCELRTANSQQTPMPRARRHGSALALKANSDEASSKKALKTGRASRIPKYEFRKTIGQI